MSHPPIRGHFYNLLFVCAAALANAAHADTITRWDFNSIAPDATPSTGSVAPAVGVGAASSIGGVAATFASADVNGGSSDPVTGDDSGWGLSTFATQGTASGARGAQFQASTLGFENVVVAYDIRHSQTSAKHELFQYALDGVNFVDAVLFAATTGDVWNNGRVVDLSSVAGTSNNPLLAFRVVAAFAPGTQAYAPTGDASNYSTLGSWRLDAVTLYGAPTNPVPEPSAWAMMGLGLLAVCSRKLRHQRSA